MALDLTATLQTIKAKQWMLGDIDWDAPGAELIRDEQRPALKQFMSDLMWIEHVGGRGFASLARSAPTEELREIYGYFQAEEQKHANAELALMQRWGMLEEGEIPMPNIEIWHALAFAESWTDNTPFDMLATFIPLLETSLDGALLKFLTDEVDDPLLNVVLNKVNSDESRHLAVGYHVLGLLGAGGMRRSALSLLKLVGAFRYVKPRYLIATMPVLAATRDSVTAMGLDGSRIYASLGRFLKVGERDPKVLNNLMYRGSTTYIKLLMDENPILEGLNRAASKVSSRYSKESWPEFPSWTKELTYKASA